jgi:hypothetical protein
VAQMPLSFREARALSTTWVTSQLSGAAQPVAPPAGAFASAWQSDGQTRAQIWEAGMPNVSECL